VMASSSLCGPTSLEDADLAARANSGTGALDHPIS
jgi:hypothetical protein